MIALHEISVALRNRSKDTTLISRLSAAGPSVCIAAATRPNRPRATDPSKLSNNCGMTATSSATTGSPTAKSYAPDQGPNQDTDDEESSTGEVVEGVIHGKTIELAVDPGLQDGEIAEVVESRGRAVMMTHDAL